MIVLPGEHVHIPAYSSNRRRPPLTLLCYAIALLIAPVSIAQSPPEAPLPFPAIPAPPIHALTPPPEQPEALRLVGITFIQDDHPLNQSPPRLDGNKPLAVDTYWVAPVRPLKTQLPATLQFWSQNGLITVEIDTSVGPPDDLPEWPPGEMQCHRVPVDLPTAVRGISGNAALTVSLLDEGPHGFVPQPLLYQEITIAPAIGVRQVGLQNLDLRLDRPFYDLNLGFRLGAGAAVDLDVPARYRPNLSHIGVVSAYSYGNLTQDQPVFEIIATNQQGNTHTAVARSGVHTARTDYDFYPAGDLDHTRIAPLESWTAEYLNAAGQSFSKHKYLGLFPLPSDFGDLRSLSLRSRNPYVVDIYDVVLLPNQPQDE